MPAALLPESHRQELERLPADYWWHEHRVASAAAALARFVEAPRAAYLDAGCAGGATSVRMASALKARRLLAVDGVVAGVDADPRGAESCRARGMHFSVADLCVQPGPGLRGFGLFSALDVLEHAESPRRFLINVAAMLAPGATGIVAVPAFQSLYSEWDRALGHRRRYDERALREELAAAGFEALWTTCLFSFAAPAARLRLSKEARFPALPAWANAALKGACAVERAALRFARLPVGTSLLAVARRR